MNNEPVAWKAYEEVHFSDQYILRWVREGDEYVSRITKEMMEDLKAIVEKELTDEEIQELSEEHLDMDWQTGVIEFARAILRKAQEK
jgi:glycyl-tRNA synthetase beta subunit